MTTRPRNTHPTSSVGLAVLASALMLLGVHSVLAAEAEKKDEKPAKSERNSLDDALLDNLDNELLEGAGDLKKPAARPANPAGDEDKPAKSSGDPNAEGEDLDMPAEEADPLVHISQEMRSVESLIPKSKSRSHAEALQKRIVDDLGRLIEQAEAQQASQQASQQQKKQPGSAKRQSVNQPKQGNSASSPGKNSNKPAADSTDRLGKAEAARPTPEQLRGMMDESWGNLPPRAREQMLQNSPERFLPQYELMIERYYRRLAEEQSPR